MLEDSDRAADVARSASHVLGERLSETKLQTDRALILDVTIFSAFGFMREMFILRKDHRVVYNHYNNT